MPETTKQPPGLTSSLPEDYPKSPSPGVSPIDLLRPGTELHKKVLDYLIERLEASEREMSSFYSRWNNIERKVQAYINQPDKERLLEKHNAAGKVPQIIAIQVPYSYATIAVIVTYLLHTFCGRKPILQIGVNKSETAEAARLMEIVIQYQADHTRLVKQLYQFLTDTQTYAVGIMRTRWDRVSRRRTRLVTVPSSSFSGMLLADKKLRQKEWRTVYEGNTVECVDPFLFFPDPRVAMTEVSQKGEFVFWRSFLGKHLLKLLEAQGVFRWVDYANPQLPRSSPGDREESVRGLRSGGQGIGYSNLVSANQLAAPFQVDQGSVTIVPRELGLDEGVVPETWIFTMLNKSQIIQAEPLGADHGMHPVCVSEPYGSQYNFGNIGMADFLGPLQDTISWFINSHIYNVRSALNNMFVVDPSKIEMQDMKNPGEGKLVRLKRSAYGQDPGTAVKQLAVQDVTGSHVRDAETLIRFGQMFSAVTDNIMGLQEPGGRKTATEVRTAGQAGASRLAAQARIISSQALTDMAEQMVVNTQQYMSDDFYTTIVGEDGARIPLRVSPEQLIGDFTYPIHDGTLPLDNVALLDVWKEILLGVARDPELRAQFSISKIFEWVAELGGAKNISSFKIQVSATPGARLEDEAAAGRVSPLLQTMR